MGALHEADAARIDNLLVKVVRRRDRLDQGTLEVLRAAMAAALDVTHEAGTPEATEAAVLETFQGMGDHLLRRGDTPPRRSGADCPESCGSSCSRCYPED